MYTLTVRCSLTACLLLQDLLERMKAEMVESEKRHTRELDELRSCVQADTRAECMKTMK